MSSAQVDFWRGWNTIRKGTEGIARNTHDSHIDLTLPIRLLGVDDP